MLGKKTLLGGFDLRRPVIFSDIRIADEKGISTWYIDGGIETIELSSFLDILPSGPRPPNPAELIASAKTKTLINKLKQKYDYIVLDTAPIGTVSDSISLASLADVTIIIARCSKTNATHLKNTISDVEESGITDISLLLNDIKFSKINNRYYGRYKYNKRYYGENNKNKGPVSWLQKTRR